MADKLVYIHNDYTQNYPFCRLQIVVKRLDTQLNKLTNQNSREVPKVVVQICLSPFLLNSRLNSILYMVLHSI